jgi:hypothetical protein
MRIRQGCWAEFHILCLVPNAPDYRYLPIIISQVILTISKGYLDSGVELDAKAIGMASLYCFLLFNSK